MENPARGQLEIRFIYYASGIAASALLLLSVIGTFYFNNDDKNRCGRIMKLYSSTKNHPSKQKKQPGNSLVTQQDTNFGGG